MLPAPIRLKTLSLSPGERADVVIDFGPLAGKEVLLSSQAFQLMQFRVKGSKPEAPASLPAVLRPVPRTPLSSVVKTRQLSLNIIVRFEGYAGRYVWHCHVLEHSSKEMMRPFEVVAPRRQARTR